MKIGRRGLAVGIKAGGYLWSKWSLLCQIPFACLLVDHCSMYRICRYQQKRPFYVSFPTKSIPINGSQYSRIETNTCVLRGIHTHRRAYLNAWYVARNSSDEDNRPLLRSVLCVVEEPRHPLAVLYSLPVDRLRSTLNAGSGIFTTCRESPPPFLAKCGRPLAVNRRRPFSNPEAGVQIAPRRLQASSR